MSLLVPLLVATAVLAALPLRHRDPGRRALGWRRAGLGWTLAFAVLAGLFVIGETGTDPGGWEAVAIDVSWLVPTVALGALAWWRPGITAPVLVTLTAVALLTDAATTLSRDHGRGDGAPVAVVSLFATAVAVGVLGRHRPAPAAWLLLAIAAVPMVVLAIGTDVPPHALLGGSTAAGTVPFAVAGVLYALAAWWERRAAPPPASPAPPTPVAIRG